MDYLPGTTVEVKQNNSAQDFLDSAFLPGGLVLSQVVQLTDLEPHTVQNWVKRKFIEPPTSKRYNCDQFCRMAIINMFKDIFQIERIVRMLDYAKGGDISDTQIYVAFSDVLTALPPDAIVAPTDVGALVAGEVGKSGSSAQAGERLQQVLKIMVLSYVSVLIRGRADFLLKQIVD